MGYLPLYSLLSTSRFRSAMKSPRLWKAELARADLDAEQELGIIRGKAGSCRAPGNEAQNLLVSVIGRGEGLWVCVLASGSWGVLLEVKFRVCYDGWGWGVYCLIREWKVLIRYFVQV